MSASGTPATPDVEAAWTAPYRVDLRAVLGPFARGRTDPTISFENDASLWWASLTPDGPATMHLRADGASVLAAGWGPGAAWLVDGLPALLGAGDDPAGFPDGRLPPALQPAWRRYRDRWRVPRSGRVVEALVIAVLEQKVTGVQSRRAWRSLVAEVGMPAPGPGPAHLRVPPAPAAIRRVPSWAWHRWGAGPRQSATIVGAMAAAGRLEQCVDLPCDVARQRLAAVRGVGPWTVAEVAQRALGDADAVSVGDFHLPKQVVYAFTGAREGTDAEMLALMEPFAGHRYRVQRLVELSDVSRPAHGPRMTIADHRSR